MKVLVTGSNGFIAKNMIEYLDRIDVEVFKYSKDNTNEDLDEFINKVDFIFHFAGINRPKNEEEFEEGNINLTQNIILKNNNVIPILQHK